eukprot:Gb_30822 [translate_table: standard]
MALGQSSNARVHKRTISDQQKRRELALQRQRESRRDLQLRARQLASALLSSSEGTEQIDEDLTQENVEQAAFDGLQGLRVNDDKNVVEEGEEEASTTISKGLQDVDFLEARKLKGERARHWFSRQLMLPEWMVDIPLRLKQEWYVLPRPAGQRCLVVSSNGTTVSRLRNGRILHHFPSALPNGARAKNVAGPGHMFCILDCIFHEPNQTYYIIDMICWRGYSLYDCSAEFRFFWLNSKIAETGACDSPSTYHRYQFSVVPIYDCDRSGLQAAYNGPLPYVKDGLLFCNRQAHYILGLTPLSLVWKDENCSQYFLDTDKKGIVPTCQQVVLELQEDGTVGTADEPPVILGSMPQQFLQQNEKHFKPGSILSFSIGDQGLRIVHGKPVVADIHFKGIASRGRASADSFSKVLFQYAARHSPLTIQDILMSVDSSEGEADTVMSD